MVQAMRAVNDSLAKALEMMRGLGFEIKDPVNVVVDPDLPFMGYTYPKSGKYTIVVSGRALESGMIEGLLVHEMSHVYRMSTGHPSHSERILNEVMRSYARRGLYKDYQQKILHDVVNHLEDLYADDISFRVFDGNQAFPTNVASQFFQSWITDKPISPHDNPRNRWANAASLLRNSFALSNMARHGTPDIEGKGRRMNETFLRQTPGGKEAFQYFYNVMIGLTEDVSETEFKKLLVEYVDRFVDLAERHPT